MLLLAIDTAGPDCAVAILRDDAVLARASERIERGHAERLMPMIEAALADAKVAFNDLNRIAVTTGPGSFTGVRIGVAVARGLALALNIPAVGVGSLDALALPLVRSRDEGTVVAALDARRGEVYALAKDLGSGEATMEAAATKVDALPAWLGSLKPPLTLVGSGGPIVVEALSGAAAEIVATPRSPDIEDVARLGLGIEEPSPPMPFYAREADARPQAGTALARR